MSCHDSFLEPTGILFETKVGRDWQHPDCNIPDMAMRLHILKIKSHRGDLLHIAFKGSTASAPIPKQLQFQPKKRPTSSSSTSADEWSPPSIVIGSRGETQEAAQIIRKNAYSNSEVILGTIEKCSGACGFEANGGNPIQLQLTVHL